MTLASALLLLLALLLGAAVSVGVALALIRLAVALYHAFAPEPPMEPEDTRWDREQGREIK